MILVMMRDTVTRCGFLCGHFRHHVVDLGLGIQKPPADNGDITTLACKHPIIFGKIRRYSATKLACPWEILRMG